ncbi:MAG: hypothetical protein LH629_02450 [Ignavibacteria bacterium]|nr:hypothetical protein [Ignavibacteria bacterium]
MPLRNQKNKNRKEEKIPKKKNRRESENDNSELKDDHKVEEMLEEEMLGELNEEDDDEFIHQVEEFEKVHSKSKMINIYDRIGKPKFKETASLDIKTIAGELKKIVIALDKFNIIVHFHNDYPDKEKYRFITEEIFKEVVEHDKKHNHITFLYEDYHPENADDEEDEDFPINL